MSAMSKLHYDENNAIIIEPIQFCPHECELFKSEYIADRSPALIGRIKDTGESAWTATVCIPDNPPEDGCVWIKNYAENEGILDALVKAQVIEFTGRFAPVGYAHAFECKLLF